MADEQEIRFSTDELQNVGKMLSDIAKTFASINNESQNFNKSVTDLGKSLKNVIKDQNKLNNLITLINNNLQIKITKNDNILTQSEKLIAFQMLTAKYLKEHLNDNDKNVLKLNQINELENQRKLLQDELIKVKESLMYMDAFEMELLKNKTSHQKLLNEEIIKQLNSKLRSTTMDLTLRYSLEKEIISLRTQNELLDAQYSAQEAINRSANYTLSEYEKMDKTLQDRMKKLQEEVGEENKKNKAIENYYETLGKGIDKLGTAKEPAKKFLEIIKTFKDPMELFKRVLIETIDRFIALDTAAEKFRIETGLLISQTKEIDANVKTLSRDFQVYGVGIEEATDAAKSLTETFGDKFIASNVENVKLIGLMKTNLGVSANESSKVLEIFMGLGNVSQEVSRNLMAQAPALTKAAGVPLNKVMQDMSKVTGQTLVHLRGNPVELVKAATEARRLGVELEKVGASAKKLLDFETSVGDELEASVLFGKNINVQRLRELAYQGRLDELVKEQSSMLQKMGDLRKMDVFQQEALAKAMGMTTDEMFQMVAKNEQLNELRQKNPDLFAQYEKEKNALSEQRQNVEDIYKNEVLQMQIQGAQTKLANQFKQIMVSIADILVPIVSLMFKLLNIALKILTPISVFLNKLAIIFEMLGEGFDLFISGVQNKLKPITDFFPKISDGTKEWTIAIVGGLMVIGLFSTKLSGLLMAPFKLMKNAAVNSFNFLKSMFSKGGMPTITPPASPTTMSSGSKIKGFLKDLGDALSEFGKDAGAKLKGIGLLALTGISLLTFAVGSPGLLALAIAGKFSTLIVNGFRAIAMGINAFGKAASNPVFWIGVGALAALTVILLGISYSMKLFSESIVKMTEPLLSLASVAPMIGLAAFSIGLLTAALASLSGVTFVSSFFGAGYIDQLVQLSKLADPLNKTATALQSISESISTLNLETANGISAVTEELTKLNQEIDKVNTSKIEAYKKLSETQQTAKREVEENNVKMLADKFDTIISLIKAGGVSINMEGYKVGMMTVSDTKFRGNV